MITKAHQAPEGFVPIPKLESRYAIDRTGLVFGIRSGKYIKPINDGSGYPAVTLCLEGKNCRKSVHCLVALTFIGPRPEGHDVNHKDGVKENSHLDNLEYCSRQENIRHSIHVLRRGSYFRTQRTEQTTKRIIEMIVAGKSLNEIGKMFGYHAKTISAISKAHGL